ncbi:hypothetical protein CYMTET_3623 [Cymbomonas tetramitiformis]|uniref:Uncharacterized protein n=1 Tax=Cymbomonas tetramitiformis TaxID=36881 RepID=A0AAE0LL68_9CHLO|nr:hypothetical protein CYMTET_3623 [Cymbomonas tetramitiformis]
MCAFQFNRACNGFEVALRLEVQNRLEAGELEEAIFLVILATLLNSYSWLQDGQLAKLVGGQGPFHWPRREHGPAIEALLLSIVNVEDAEEGSMIIPDFFGADPTPYGLGLGAF